MALNISMSQGSSFGFRVHKNKLTGQRWGTRNPKPEHPKLYFPLNSGFRFSRNALTPSSLSSVEKQSAKRSTSRRKPSSRFDRDASFTASFAKPNAIGLLVAMRLAISIVFASRRSAGTTWFTRPMVNAVFASMMSPVRIISIALPSPTRRVKRCVPPPPGMMPRLISGWPNEAASLACDLRIASEAASFGQPEINLGIIPGGGGTQRLTRLVGEGKAMEMILTGDIIDAKTAFAIGLVNHVFPADLLEAKTMEIANRIATKSPIALGLAKEAVKLGSRSNLDEGLRREVDLFALCFSTEDKDEGVSAFLEKRKPEFKGK